MDFKQRDGPPQSALPYGDGFTGERAVGREHRVVAIGVRVPPPCRHITCSALTYVELAP